MKRTVNPVTEHEIHAYIDGQLAPERCSAVVEYLSLNPAEKKRVEELQLLNQMLRTRDKFINPEFTPGFEPDIMSKTSKRTIKTPFYIAASLACTLFGGFVGWHLHSRQQFEQVLHATLPQRAAYAHAVYTPEVRHPVEVSADQEQHLIQWLSKRIGKTLTAPDLSQHDYHLIGGRLLPGHEVPAAQFMYENNSGNRLTLYVRDNAFNNGDSAFRFAREKNISIFYWIDNSLGYALSGELDKNELLNIATTVYRWVEPGSHNGK